MSSESSLLRKKLFFEAVIIIGSVFLGMFLNEWRMDIKEERQTKEILRQITQELKNNRDYLDELIPYHKKLLKQIRTTVETDSIEEKMFRQGRFSILGLANKGIIQREFHDIAWTVGKDEKLTTRIPFELSEKLYEAYAQHPVVNETIGRIINVLSSRTAYDHSRLEETTRICYNSLQELIAQEHFLMAKYNKAIEALNGE